METLLNALGDEIDDSDEETFHLFSQAQTSQDLGMVDAKTEELDLSIAGRDFTIKQSPGVLQSKREGGTTGAAVWRACVLLAKWIGSPKNFLFKRGILGSSSIALELGTGISGLIPSILSPRVSRVLATDQQYALKLLQENINANRPVAKGTTSNKQRLAKSNIDILALDWETDDVTGFLRTYGLEDGVDAVLICDCIFNYALVDPLVQTCAEICKARPAGKAGSEAATVPTVCVIAQQLRQPEVFELWLKEFMAIFHVWRVPDELLTDDLREGSGLVLHIGVLRKD